jgi:hypothetical protein
VNARIIGRLCRLVAKYAESLTEDRGSQLGTRSWFVEFRSGHRQFVNRQLVTRQLVTRQLVNSSVTTCVTAQKRVSLADDMSAQKRADLAGEIGNDRLVLTGSELRMKQLRERQLRKGGELKPR